MIQFRPKTDKNTDSQRKISDFILLDQYSFESIN